MTISQLVSSLDFNTFHRSELAFTFGLLRDSHERSGTWNVFLTDHMGEQDCNTLYSKVIMSATCGGPYRSATPAAKRGSLS